MRWILTLLLIALWIPLTGCSGSGRRVGIPNRWRSPTIQFQPGTTTEEDVLRRLGPPSQIVALQDRTVYFYVLEEADSFRLGMFLFAWSSLEVTYDRAVFFFDRTGRLVRHAYSPKAIDYDEN